MWITRYFFAIWNNQISDSEFSKTFMKATVSWNEETNIWDSTVVQYNIFLWNLWTSAKTLLTIVENWRTRRYWQTWRFFRKKKKILTFNLRTWNLPIRIKLLVHQITHTKWRTHADMLRFERRERTFIKSFPNRISLQQMASIQPRKSPWSLDHRYLRWRSRIYQ